MFDGTRCAVSGTSDQPGAHKLAFTGTAGQPSGVTVVGIRAPHTWTEVTALLPELTLSRLRLIGSSRARGGGPGGDWRRPRRLVHREDLAGVICFAGEWPTPTFIPGTRPSRSAAGPIGPA